MAKSNLILSYAEGWQTVYGPDPSVRERCECWFSDTFPNGHATSIRPIVKEVLERITRGDTIEPESEAHNLMDIHPRALKLLAKYGVDFTPYDWTDRHPESSELQPKPGQCFANSWCMMEALNRDDKLSSPMVYVEGVSIGPLVHLMHHAWNAFGLGDTVAFDWSHYIGSEWNRQLGISVTQEEYEHMRRLVYPNPPRRLIRILHETEFPAVESYLTDLLARRADQPAISS